MEKMDKIYNDTNLGIDAKLDSIHKDLKRLMERSNQEYLDLMLTTLKKEFLNSINSYISDDVKTGLENGMVEDCEMRESCKSTFTSYLLNNEELILGDNVPSDIIEEKKDELVQIRKNAPFEFCDDCFSEVHTLFNKQLGLISSIKIYKTDNEKRSEISTLPDSLLVKTVLEPLSNKQRLQILKSLASETKTFSTLSELTGLRGGNLLFHIQKLLENDLIIQRHDRGDYMITRKGFNLLLILVDINKLLENE